MTINYKHNTFLYSLVISIFLFLTTSCRSTKEATIKEKPDGKIVELKAKYAGILGTSTEQISNVKLYQFIDEWYGTPYKYGGKTKDGVDCSDFTAILCETVYNKKVEVPASKIYSMTQAIDLKDIQEGDLVFFKIESSKISHVGIYLQNNKFIHSSTKKGVIINDLNEAYYKKYFHKAGRLK